MVPYHHVAPFFIARWRTNVQNSIAYNSLVSLVFTGVLTDKTNSRTSIMTRRIEDLIGEKNIATLLDKDELEIISSNACEGFDIDKRSRESWEKKNDEAKKLANQVFEKKDYPFKSAANIKYPLLATSAIQFSARAYPNFVKAPDVVKAMVVGDDPQGIKASIANRISRHMSYQILHEMDEWEEDTDKLLTILPIIGCGFKKTWFSPVLGRNVSEFRNPYDIVMHYKTKSMLTVPRITELYTLYPNELEERKRSGTFLKRDYGNVTSAKDEDDEIDTNDPDSPHVFMEQHTYLDLDKDDYKEPYIVTVHKDSKKVARITSRFFYDGIMRNDRDTMLRVQPEHYYTKFSFMPALDESIYDFGFGGLLSPINRTIDTTINQLLDAGTLYNSNAGFLGKGIQLGRGRGGGRVEFELGEWKHIGFSGDDLRKNIVPLPVKEPSMVLFNLLGFMVQAGERLSSVTEILTGDQSNESERPTTTLARIEQGLMVFSSIHKRLYKAFREEYKKLFRLNGRYLEPLSYYNILDNQQAIAQQDYNYETCDVVPVADPNEMTNTQKRIKAETMMGVKGQGFNDAEINRRFLEALQVPEMEKLLDAPDPPEDPKVVIDRQKLQLEAFKLDFEKTKYMDQREEIAAKTEKTLAQAIQALANAEAAEVGPQLEMYKTQLQAITERFKVENANKQQAVGSVAGKQRNAGSVQDTKGKTD